MKTKIYKLWVSLMAVALLAGCDDWEPAGTKFAANTGGVNLGEMAVDVNTNTTPASRAGVDTSGYIVTVADENGATVVYNDSECTWTYADMPEVITLPVGSYTINVESHKVEKAAWDAPYFAGSKEFEVKDGEITAIGTVTCVFSSIKVTVKFADDLAKVMEAGSQAEVVANDEGSLTWTATETRTGYFEALDGSTTLVATFTGTIKGQSITRTKAFTDVEKGKYYIITFSLKTGPAIPDETGSINPDGGITVDSEIEEADENGNIDAPEEPDTPDARPDNEEWPDPNIPDGPDNPDNPTGDTIDFDLTGSGLLLGEGNENPTDATPAVVNIYASAGINNLKVTISSDNSSFIDSAGELLPLSFDLAHIDDAKQAESFSNDLGLPVNDQVLGKGIDEPVVFDVTALLPLLDAFPGQHKFSLEVIDMNGNKKSTVLVIRAN